MNDVNLKTIDNYLEDASYQLIDIREVNECIYNGMIKHFEIIPFYSVLKAGDAFYPLDHAFNDWAFRDLEAFKRHFKEDKTIVLICNSGNRSAALKKALDFLGYDVIDIGGIIDYEGKYLVKPKLDEKV